MQGLVFRHFISYLARLAKALKKSTRAPMSNAKSISIGPLVVADAPKKMMRLMSSIPKTTLTTKSGSGRRVFKFIRLFILSISEGDMLVICSIQYPQTI
ncbi:MAG TPA: hypothetical protein DDW33_12310 [Ktedonobacter sp.]|jgi:hypothetical protein|nr:hypothetical protein [Ktedonobacter sp.]HCJ35312.1 hypothetical protein [Ktedonobacter sp.]